MKRLYRKAGSKISETSIAKKVLDSEEYKNLKKSYRQVKEEASGFKEDLKEEVETAQNPVVGSARSLGGYVFKESPLSQATAKMKEYDHEFDIHDLHPEIEEIFTDLYDSFLEGDLEYIEKF